MPINWSERHGLVAATSEVARYLAQVQMFVAAGDIDMGSVDHPAGLLVAATQLRNKAQALLEMLSADLSD